MNWRNTPERYSTPSMALHWLMLLLLVAVYATMELHEFYPKGSAPREALKTWHFMLGLSVFGLVGLRVLARVLGGPVPPIKPEPSKLQHLSAALIHLALYALMIGMPLAGWLILSAAGKPIPFFGLQLPALIAENKELAEQIKELHEVGGTVGYVLIGVHAVAALVHHHLTKDNTLKRILPGQA
jgi:superoxide oxidase